MSTTDLPKAKLVVLISGSGSNLQAFIDRIAAQQLNAEICAVISNNSDAYGLERAKAAEIEGICIDHKQFASRADFDQALAKSIKAYSPDWIILAGFMRILTADFVNQFSDKLINIHPSLLPKYPGTNTHQRALDAGDEEHGVSIHFVVPEVDAGPIILQGSIKINGDDSADSLQQRIHKIEHQLYPQAIEWLISNKAVLHGNQVLIDGKPAVNCWQSFDV